IGFALTWFVPEHSLRETVAAVAGDVGRGTEEIFPMPTDADSVRRVERALSLLATRDVKREYIQRVVRTAGVDLTPLAAWLLVRYERDVDLDLDALGSARRVDPERLRGAAEELRARGLVEEHPAADGAPARRVITAAGCRALGALVEARRAHLATVLAEWDPEKREEWAAALGGLFRELVPDAPAGR